MSSLLLRRPLSSLAAATAASALAFTLASPPRRERAAHAVEGLTRFSRAAGYGALCALDYRFSVDPVSDAHGSTSPQYAAARRATDTRCAERLLHVARLHGGAYAKLAQYLSTMNHVLSPEWTGTLAAMQQDARHRPWAEMAPVVEEELGRPWTEVFASVDPTPIAAASIAQVHRAVLVSGERVALKLQYPDLRRTALADMAALALFFQLLAVVSPSLDLTWMYPEFLASLTAETNFLQEASNTTRAAAMLRDDPRVRVPRVHSALSSERMLVLEWVDGKTLRDLGGDASGLTAWGIDPVALRAVVVDTFNSLIFSHGFIHCDPHPANLMVVKGDAVSAKGQPWQLVVIDWGMVRRLEPSFRQGYCSLWRALVVGDTPGGIAAVKALGMSEDAYDALALMLTLRASSGRTALGGRLSRDERTRVRARYEGVTARDINLFMQTLPRDLLFVFRTTNLVRSLNLNLSGSSRERFAATGRGAVAGLALSRAMGAPKLPMPLPPGAAAAYVVDMPSSLADAVKSSSSNSMLSSLMAALSAALGKEPPPRAPLTFLTAVEVGGSTNARTESEAFSAARGGRGGVLSTLTTSERVWGWVDLRSLELRLWAIDAVAAGVGWWWGVGVGSDELKHPTASAGAAPDETEHVRKRHEKEVG